MNREQRRAYARVLRSAKQRGDKNIFICPVCKHETRYYTVRLNSNIELQCEYCHASVKSGPALAKIFPPGIYSPWDLNALDIIIEEMEKKDNGTEGKENSLVREPESSINDEESSGES